MLTVANYSYLMGKLAKAALWISGTGLVVMTIAIAWQVFGRFVLNDTPAWTEPLSLVLMLYFILLTAAVGIREHFHLGMDFFQNIASESTQQLMARISNLMVGFFGLTMLWWGGQLTAQTWSVKIPVLGLPEGISYLPLPLSGTLIFLFSIEQIINPAARKNLAPVSTTAE
ncbi:MAG: TRAP transporter small permease [Alphaproteobacteria bacterium]